MRSKLLAFLLFGAGCGPGSELPATEGCTSTRHCNLREVCDRNQNACVPEPTDGLMGNFACTVFERQPTREQLNGVDRGASELVGSFGGTRLAILSATDCFFHDVGFFARAIQHSLNPEAPSYLWTMLIEGGAQIELGKPFPLGTLSTVTRIKPNAMVREDYEILAYVSGGTVTFDAPPVAGQKITGFLDVKLEAYVP